MRIASKLTNLIDPVKSEIMASNDLSTILDAEWGFFSEVLASQKGLSEEQKVIFRAETVECRRERLSQFLFSKLNGRVAYGPFTGLELDPTPAWGKTDLSSMLLGVYELQVLNALHSPEFSDRNHFVDIGAADGYYAVGCLHNGRFKTADCFEIREIGRETIKRNAKLNGVADKVRIFGAADASLPSLLKEIDWSDTVILCDIEGAELDLFDPTFLAAIKGAIILIEIHNWVEDFWPRYVELLKCASKDYELRFPESSALPRQHLPELRGMTDDNRMLILSEGRPNVMRFLQLISRDGTR